MGETRGSLRGWFYGIGALGAYSVYEAITTHNTNPFAWGIIALGYLYFAAKFPYYMQRRRAHILKNFIHLSATLGVASTLWSLPDTIHEFGMGGALIATAIGLYIGVRVWQYLIRSVDRLAR